MVSDMLIVALFVLLSAMYYVYLIPSCCGSPQVSHSCSVVFVTPPAVTQHTGCNTLIYMHIPVRGHLNSYGCGGGLPLFDLASLKLVTWNVRGLRAKPK